MSRTDHHNPTRVRAHQAHADGLATEEDHSSFCVNYVNRYPRFGGLGPRTHEVRYVDRSDAEANGWTITWEEHSRSARVYARVPVAPHECDIDLVHGRCTRWIEDRDRMPYTGPIGKANRRTYYWEPERAAVRSSLRRALAEARYGGDVDEIVPTAQHRHAMFRGGWWD